MHYLRNAFLLNLTFLYPHGFIADFLNLVKGVGNNNNGGSLILNILQTIEALLLEADIANRQYLINQQNIRIHIDCHGKSQTHVHTR